MNGGNCVRYIKLDIPAKTRDLDTVLLEESCLSLKGRNWQEGPYMFRIQMSRQRHIEKRDFQILIINGQNIAVASFNIALSEVLKTMRAYYMKQSDLIAEELAGRPKPSEAGFFSLRQNMQEMIHEAQRHLGSLLPRYVEASESALETLHKTFFDVIAHLTNDVGHTPILKAMGISALAEETKFLKATGAFETMQRARKKVDALRNFARDNLPEDAAKEILPEEKLAEWDAFFARYSEGIEINDAFAKQATHGIISYSIN